MRRNVEEGARWPYDLPRRQVSVLAVLLLPSPISDLRSPITVIGYRLSAIGNRKSEPRTEESVPYPWWMIALAVLGASTLLSGMITLFSSLGRRPRQITATHVPGVADPDFLEALAGTVNAPLMRGGQATLLDNGDAYFPAILEAIAGATRTIDFFVYIWEPGEASDLVFEALIERARAGVQVRLLLDAFGAI